MTREEAFALVADLVEAGFSCTVNVGVHETLMPRENVSVHVRSVRFEHVQLARLIEIGEAHGGLELHLIGADLRFVEISEQLKARKRVGAA